MSQEKKPFDIHQYLGQISALKTTHEVEAVEAHLPGFKEAGLPAHLHFHCPACKHTRAVAGEGKFLCVCGAPLDIKKKA